MATLAISTHGPQVGATGWSYNDVLPYFRKSEGIGPTSEAPIDARHHNTTARLVYPSAHRCFGRRSDFVEAAVAAGIPRGDYNGRDR